MIIKQPSALHFSTFDRHAAEATLYTISASHWSTSCSHATPSTDDQLDSPGVPLFVYYTIVDCSYAVHSANSYGELSRTHYTIQCLYTCTLMLAFAFVFLLSSYVDFISWLVYCYYCCQFFACYCSRRRCVSVAHTTASFSSGLRLCVVYTTHPTRLSQVTLFHYSLLSILLLSSLWGLWWLWSIED